MAFEHDIKTRDTALFPVVRIPSINFYISTKSFSIKNKLDDDFPVNYTPLLLSSPSVKESFDIQNRRYKISNVSLKISNIEYNGVRFSDAQIPINTEVSIYWVSPSCRDITECFEAYIGIIRAITHDEKTCSIALEDISQSTLHRDVPIKLLGTTKGFTDKYKNKPYPMVYGTVDKSPCVLGELSIYNPADPSVSNIRLFTDINDTV